MGPEVFRLTRQAISGAGWDVWFHNEFYGMVWERQDGYEWTNGAAAIHLPMDHDFDKLTFALRKLIDPYGNWEE